MTNRRVKLYVDASPLAENNITGIPHFTAELTKALDQHPDNGKKFELILLIAFDKKQKLNRWQYKQVRVKSIWLPMRLLNLIWKYNLLPPMDLFIGRGVYLFPNYKNWRLIRSRSMTYIHDLSFMRYPQFTQPKNLAFLQANIHKWINRTSLVLTGSDHARQEIINLLDVSSKKIVRIYHGVNREQYYPRKTKEIDIAKAKYDIDGSYILYIGSLEPRKNLARLIASYRDLPDSLRSKYGLCIIGGGGWLNGDILSAIDQAKKDGFNIIQPSHYVDDADLPALISGAHLLVHPALYEGFGLSPLQAMACGTPALVANNSSLPEVVESAGILVDAKSQGDISAKIEKALTDKNYRAALITAGLTQAQKFDWATSADELLQCAYKVENS